MKPDSSRIAVALVSELDRDPLIKLIPELRDELIFFRDENGKIRARSSICPHAGGDFQWCPKKRELRCRWHGLRFDVDGGACRDRPTLRLREYFCESDGVQVFVRRKSDESA